MLKLAKLLHSKGFFITYVNSEFNYQRLLRSVGSDALHDLPSFHFETIPDGLPPPENPDATQDVASTLNSLYETGLGPFKSVLSKVSTLYSPVTCMVSDFLMSFTLPAAEELGIPAVLFWTSGAGSLICYDQYPNLIQKGLMPLKGPVHLLETNNVDRSLDIIKSNLWIEDPKCLKWLDGKEPLSVVYVNFGSITMMTPQQLVEFCWGLAKSNYSFLWIIRSDLVLGDSAVLPQEFLVETSSRGLLASWCPQEQVLNHPSIGGFLTHSGWNSTIESISSGVPMICLPFFADQQPNCWWSCNKWMTAMEIDNDVKSDEVSKLVWRKGKSDEKECH